MSGRIVYSTGDLDYSIAARLYTSYHTNDHRAVLTAFMFGRDIHDVRIQYQRRHGKAKAGHYTRVFK